ncbi:hypothetical protein HanPI659440_Chr17g0676481 [Helianthus annuus]|nr:hypothetical protein HanPI659440_Chr17g0676481 [Helianthus annuus]
MASSDSSRVDPRISDEPPHILSKYHPHTTSDSDFGGLSVVNTVDSHRIMSKLLMASNKRVLGGGQLQKNRGCDCVGLAIEEQADNQGGMGGVYASFGVAEKHQNEDGSRWVGLALGK